MPTLLHYLERMCDISLFAKPKWFGKWDFLANCIFILIMFVVEWLQRNKQHGLEVIGESKYKWLRVAFYYILILLIISNAGTEQTFIYFQF